MPNSNKPCPREDWQTPEQHAAALEFRRAHDSGKRKLCDVMEFWRVCADKACLRSRGCRGNPHTCFGIFWPHVPEDIKDDIRALIAEAAGKPEKAQTYRRGAQEIGDAMKAPAQSEPEPANGARETHMPRIRTL